MNVSYKQYGHAGYASAYGPIQWPWETNAAMLSIIVVICTLQLTLLILVSSVHIMYTLMASA